MVLIYATSTYYDDADWRALTLVDTAEDAQALCATYAAIGRVDGPNGPWSLAWVALEQHLDLSAIRALLTDVVRAESRLSGDDETTPEEAQERIARWRAEMLPSSSGPSPV